MFGFQQKTHISSIIFESIGLLFGTTGLWRTITNKSETVLILFLSMFGMIASILCTGILFDQFAMDLTKPIINSLEDLTPNIILFITNEFNLNSLGLKKM